MQIARTIAELRERLARHDSPSFVPTMGNLHDGHLDLVDHARTLGDVTVASIFVNRLQFLPHEDFDTYPRTFEADCERLQAHGCDLVFAPSEAELYPERQGFKIQPPAELADILEGHYRPGFFVGVCTVVMKLFQCVFAQSRGPRHAVFGKKDYQQFMVLRQMARQFALPVTLHGVETRRADDGLALSSRNLYLSPDERQEAVQLSRALRALADAALRTGHAAAAGGGAAPQPLAALESQALEHLAKRGWQPDYLTVRRRADLQTPGPGDCRAGELVVLGAARLGRTRLIDNLEC